MRPKRSKNIEQLYFKRGLAKINNCLDVVTFLRTQKRLKQLEKMVFNSRQLVLSKMSRWNYLSANSSSTSDTEYPQLSKLLNYKISGTLDNRLLKATTRKTKFI